MVGRPRRGRAVLFAAGRGAAAGAGAESNCRPEMPLPVKLERVQELAATGDERARLHLPNHRRVFRLRHRALRRFLRRAQRPGAGPRDDRRGRRLDSGGGRARAARGVPGARRAHPHPRSRREGKAPRPGHRGRQPARHPITGEDAHESSQDRCRYLRPRRVGRRRGAGAHHAPGHRRAPGRYRNHGLPRHRRVLRPARQVVHRRGGDQRRRQPAHGDLRRFHRRGDAAHPPHRAAQGRLSSAITPARSSWGSPARR